ncbi:MAG: MarR family transcriptional regulator [Acidobacteriota bacterium]|nr:MarR family transcriptional regulator [Acidobacteriota bacterium]
MDFRHSVEALIPGVQGRVLGVLARAGTDLTMRRVADLAGVSPQQASVVIGKLVELGVVERRDVPPASLVRLAAENLAAQAVLSLADLRQAALERLGELALDIRPAPVSLMVFGSFARGEADAESDLDVLAVRCRGLARDDDEWTDSLWSWTAAATRAVGNPVNVMEAGEEEISGLLRRPGPTVWTEIVRDGIVLVGSRLELLAEAA